MKRSNVANAIVVSLLAASLLMSPLNALSETMPAPASQDDAARPTAEGNAMGFTIELAFTPLALQSLTERGEEVIVSASYYADPSDEGQAYVNAVGRIDLGSEEVQVNTEPGIAEFSGPTLDTDRLFWVDGDISVNVNVFTARLSSPENLISCDFVDGPLAQVIEAQALTLRCALIGEDMETILKP